MNRSLLLVLLFCAGIEASAQEFAPFYELRERADRSAASGDLAAASQSYQDLLKQPLSGLNRRAISFHAADCDWRIRWREEPDAAWRSLETIAEIIRAPASPKDNVWALAQESIADYQWQRDAKSANWLVARQAYELAIKWWTANPALPESAASVSRILTKAAAPPWGSGMSYGAHGNWFTAGLLQQCLKLNLPPASRALANYLIAKSGVNSGAPPAELRRHYEAALACGKSCAWHDAALFDYAVFLGRQGEEQKAAQIFARLEQDYLGTASHYLLQARQLAQSASSPLVELKAEKTPLGEPPVLNLAWANTASLRLELFRLDLLKDLKLDSEQSLASPWFAGDKQWYTNSGNLKPVWSWSGQVAKERSMQHKELPLPAKFSSFVSLAVLNSGPPLLVPATQLYVSLALEAKNARVFVADVKTGNPIPAAKAILWEKVRSGLSGRIFHSQGVTNQRGVAELFLKKSVPSDLDILTGRTSGAHQILVFVESGGSQAFTANVQTAEGWQTALGFERDSYCPGNVVRWTLMAQRGGNLRQRDRGVEAEFIHPKGVRVGNKSLELDRFGVARGAFRINPRWSPGTYELRMVQTDSLTGEKQTLLEKPLQVGRCN